jgi:hypothetical protein
MAMLNSGAPPGRIWPATFAVFVLVFSMASASAACLKDNTDGQAVEDKLAVQRAKVAAGRPERPYILQLAANACLDTQDPDEAVKATRTIHVYPADEKAEPVFKQLVGKTVTVSGNPFVAHTAHHHAPIVMRVDQIQPVLKR